MLICIWVPNYFRHKRLARFTLVFQMLGILFLVLLLLPLPFGHCGEDNCKALHAKAPKRQHLELVRCSNSLLGS